MGWIIIFNETPLHLAYEKGHLSVVEYLLRKGADSRDENYKTSFLHLAAKNGHLGGVEYLINHKADVNAKNKYVE